MTATLDAPTGTENEVAAVPFNLPTMEEIANLDDTQVAALLELMRKMNASVRQTAVARNIPLPDVVTRKVGPSRMLQAAGKVGRIRFDVDRYTEHLRAAQTELDEARTAYLTSNGIAELPADIVTQLETSDSTAYTDKQRKAAEKSAAPSTTENAVNPGRRGRPRKNAAPAVETEGTEGAADSAESPEVAS